jgi:hypothetical protein
MISFGAAFGYTVMARMSSLDRPPDRLDRILRCLIRESDALAVNPDHWGASCPEPAVEFGETGRAISLSGLFGLSGLFSEMGLLLFGS